MISPALFIEDLAGELEAAVGIDKKDILMYADDILTLCTSPHQLERAMTVIEDWSRRNGMVLNKSKSGIVVFAPRGAGKIPKMKLFKKNEPGRPKNTGKWVPAQEVIRGVPICSEYKYLGSILTPKLSCDAQSRQIRKKGAYFCTRLYPYLM